MAIERERLPSARGPKGRSRTPRPDKLGRPHSHLQALPVEAGRKMKGSRPLAGSLNGALPRCGGDKRNRTADLLNAIQALS